MAEDQRDLLAGRAPLPPSAPHVGVVAGDVVHLHVQAGAVVAANREGDAAQPAEVPLVLLPRLPPSGKNGSAQRRSLRGQTDRGADPGSGQPGAERHQADACTPCLAHAPAAVTAAAPTYTRGTRPPMRVRIS